MKMNKDFSKSVFVGVFTGAFALALFYLLFKNLGKDLATEMGADIALIISAFPYLAAAAIAYYAGSFTNMILKKRRSGDENQTTQ